MTTELKFKQEIRRRDEQIDALYRIIEPLVQIADAYYRNDLDDEARRFWGENLEHENRTPLDQIVLVSGRGGKTLLTLKDCFDAKLTKFL